MSLRTFSWVSAVMCELFMFIFVAYAALTPYKGWYLAFAAVGLLGAVGYGGAAIYGHRQLRNPERGGEPE